MNEKHFNLLRWTPVVASMALMVLVFVISVTTVSELKRATHWRDHTFDVILDARTFEDKLIDAQDSARDYVEKGRPKLLIEYRHDTNIDMQEFNRLWRLTRDDPGQQLRLRDLEAAVQAVFSNDNRVIGIYARQGGRLSAQPNSAVGDEEGTERAMGDLQQFTHAEERLLTRRDATEQKDYHRAAHFLVFGSMLVSALLVLANLVVSRQMERRRRAEQQQRGLIEKLQKALTEVKTLSGLIPICGWCKKVRNDSGYWQSVEQYVHSHTDADFSHGICPSCAEKFKAGMRDSERGSQERSGALAPSARS